jgi:hypothetical protein
MSSLTEQTKSVKEFPRKAIRSQELADLLCISLAALSSQRRRRTGPPVVLREGCHPYYSRDEVLAWLLAQEQRNAQRSASKITPDPSLDCAEQ